MAAYSFTPLQVTASFSWAEQSRRCVGARANRQWSAERSLTSSFSGQRLPCKSTVQVSSKSLRPMMPTVVSEAVVQFIRGLDETTVPEVRLTRARDGSSGTATFIFKEPTILQNLTELGDITGFYMIDDEGLIQSMDLSCQFVDGKPMQINARYVMRSEGEWDRFMRFMERYAESAGLGFSKK